MKNISTLSLQKSLSKVFPSKIVLGIEILFLLFLGIFAITLHAKLRIPLHIPGKHGLIFMFLLIAGFSLTQIRYAALIACSGASALLFTNLLGFADPFIAVTYLIMGFSMDFLLNRFHFLQAKFWFVALVCGISYAIIPVSRIFIHLLTGFPYSSLLSGYIFPILSHFLFGSLGGLLGFLTLQATKKK